MAENQIDQKQGRRRRNAQPDTEPDSELMADYEESESTTRGITGGKGRATPGRRNQLAVEPEGNAVTRPISGVREYLETVRAELGKVAWPTRPETLRLTGIVLMTLVASAIVLGLIALGFTELFRIGLNQPFILFGVIFAAVAIGFVINFSTRRKARS